MGEAVLSEEGKGREFGCVDAKQAVLLGVRACKLELESFIEQCRCDLTEQGPEAEARQGHHNDAVAGGILLVCK